MRRHEFALTDAAEIDAILERAEHGVLATVDESGAPYTVPVNFVWDTKTIAFHGAVEGEKMRHLRRFGQVSFTVVEPLSLIPSYFSDPEFACPATQFFLSVTVRGIAKEVASSEAKAPIMEALMQKLQPEGGYRPITPEDHPTAITAKAKAAQHLPKERFDAMIGHLEARGAPLDLRTVSLMRRLYPQSV